LVHELAELAVRARRPASAAQCPLTGHADVRLWQHLRPCRVWNPFDGCHWQVTCLSSDQRDPNCKSKTANTSRSDGHYGRAPASRRQRTAGSAQWKRQPASLQAQAGDVAPQTYHEVMRRLSEEARRRAGESARPRAHTGSARARSAAPIGDHGLAPLTSYTWHVTAIVGGAERAPSPSARATTQATPAICAAPGTCP
jgi:hypothetical protein